MPDIMGQMDIAFPNLNVYLENVPKNFEVFGMTIALYGVIIGIGFLSALILISRIAVWTGQKSDDYWDMAAYIIIFSIVGARIYYVIFAWDYYKDNLLSIFNIRQGGLAIYGGVLAGIACLAVLSKIRKLDFLQVLDVSILGVVIGQIFGRWGNFFNREVFGQYTDGLFAMLLPLNSIRSQQDVTPEMLTNLVHLNGVDYISVHPTFLYESLWNFGLLIIMLLMRKKKKFNGQIFFMYLLGYGAGRFWIEGIRTDQLKLWGTNLPVSQLVAAVMVVLGALLITYNLMRSKKQ